MPNSGTVTAGSVALASQYNNLRSDVLDASTGHTHTGAADAGARIEGTALKSTGATNGHVLTANGSGGVSFAAVQGAGAITVSSATATYGTASSTAITTYTPQTNAMQFLSSTSGGTMFASQPRFTSYTQTVQNIIVYNQAGTQIGSFAPPVNGAGSSVWTHIGSGSAAHTAILVIEHNQTTSTSVTWVARKYSTAGSLIWTSEIASVSTTSGGNDPSYGPAAYTLCGNDKMYIPTVGASGMWLFSDGQNTSLTSGTASIYAINDASGSVYSAPLTSTARSTAFRKNKSLSTYVPPVTGDGTVYVACRISTDSGTTYTPQLNKFTLSATGFTALSTATGSSAFAPITNATTPPNFMHWVPQATAIAWWDDAATATVGNLRWLDRTGGTIVSTIKTSFNPPSWAGGGNVLDRINWVSGIAISDSGGDNWYYFGTADLQSAAAYNGGTAGKFLADYTRATNSGQSTILLTSGGSATRVALQNSNSGGVAWELQSYLITQGATTVQVLGTASTNRLVYFNFSGANNIGAINAVSAAGAQPFGYTAGHPFPIVLPGTSTLSVVVQPFDNSSGVTNITYNTAGTFVASVRSIALS